MGLRDVVLLPDSENSDVITCSCAADLDFDGQHELILGTYGQVSTSTV